MGEVRFMISEAAKQVHVESHVLRYWEEELDLNIGRTEMGHRYYTEEDIQLFCCIRKLKNEGVLLRDLKPLIPKLQAAKNQVAAPSAKLSTASQTSTMPASKGTCQSNTIPIDKNSSQNPNTSLDKNSSQNPNTFADKNGNISNTCLPSASVEADVLPASQLEQARLLFGDILKEVILDNNKTLEYNISQKVTADVLREMEFLFQAKERLEEEHFRKLDCLIRQQQATRKESAKESAIGKLLRTFQ